MATEATDLDRPCAWRCGDGEPGHRHYAVLVRENGRLLGRLTPTGTVNRLADYAWVMSRAKAREVAASIQREHGARGVTAKVIPF